MTGAAPSTSPVSTRWRATNWQMAPSWRAYLGSQPYGRGEERARISEREPRGQRFGGASPPERPPRPRRCLRVRSAGRRRCARRHPRPPEPRRWGRGRRARRGRARCRDGGLQPARTPAAGPDVELDAQAAKRGRRRVRRRVDAPADVARANPVHTGAGRFVLRLALRTWHGAREAPVAPRHPRRRQPDRAARPARRDIERLFGVGKVRAAALMQTFGAELVGNQKTLPRTKLLQQLKKHRGRAACPADRGPVQGAHRRP